VLAQPTWYSGARMPTSSAISGNGAAAFALDGSAGLQLASDGTVPEVVTMVVSLTGPSNLLRFDLGLLSLAPGQLMIEVDGQPLLRSDASFFPIGTGDLSTPLVLKLGTPIPAGRHTVQIEVDPVKQGTPGL